MKKFCIGFIILFSLIIILPGNMHIQAEESNTIRVMSFNIQQGIGIDNNKLDLERTANVIRESGADVVGLQEVDRFYGERSDYQDQLEVLAELLKDDGFIYYEYGANLDLEPHDGYDARQYGTGFLSKFEITDYENIHLPLFKEQRGLQKLTLDVNGMDITVYNTHLGRDDENRLLQMQEIIDITSNNMGHQILLGDLNTRENWEDFELLMKESNFTDTFADIENNETFDPVDPRYRIDFILTSPLITFDNQKIIDTKASDHLPIMIDATLSERGMIELTVHDQDSPGVMLENVRFELRDADGNVVDSDIATDEDGQAVIENIEAGDYELLEIEPSIGGYDLNPDSISITVGKGNIQKVSVGKELTRGSVEIENSDADNDSILLTDGVFEVQDKDGQTIQSDITSDEEGHILVHDLIPGNYQIMQIKAPTNYTLNQDPIKFSIDKGQVDATIVTLTNEIIKSKAELFIIDKSSNQPIIDGTFELQNEDGHTLETGLTVSTSGKLVMDGLTPGLYKLIAIETPAGFEKIKKPIEFEIKKNLDDVLVLIISLHPLSDDDNSEDSNVDQNVDINALENKVNEIMKEDLDEAEFTSESWESFTSIFKNAQNLLNISDMDQADIDNLLSDLESAKEDLTLVDNDVSDIDNANNNDEGDYSKDNNEGNATINNGTNNNTNKGNGKNDKKETSGKELPKTASPMFNFIIIGFTILLAASVMLFTANRKKE